MIENHSDGNGVGKDPLLINLDLTEKISRNMNDFYSCNTKDGWREK